LTSTVVHIHVAIVYKLTQGFSTILDGPKMFFSLFNHNIDQIKIEVVFGGQRYCRFYC